MQIPVEHTSLNIKLVILNDCILITFSMLRRDKAWHPSSHEVQCLVKLTELITKARKLFGLQMQLAVKGTSASQGTYYLSKLG